MRQNIFTDFFIVIEYAVEISVPGETCRVLVQIYLLNA